MAEKTDIYFNGKFVGDTDKPEQYVDNIRKKRRMGLLSTQLNIVYYAQFSEIRVSTEAGRVRRPLVIVENGRSKLTESIEQKLKEGQVDWNYLILHGVVEYVDAKEEENALIALKKEDITSKHTHLEIDQ